MAERRVRVGAPVGLHARPAALFVRAAVRCGYPVQLSCLQGQAVNAHSILEVLTLDVQYGEEVVLSVDGPEEILDNLAMLLESDLRG